METQTSVELPIPAARLALPNSQPLMDIADRRPRARTIVDAIPQPVQVLYEDPRVVTANCSARTQGGSGQQSFILEMETTGEVGDTLAQTLVISVGTGLFAFTLLAALVVWVSL